MKCAASYDDKDLVESMLGALALDHPPSLPLHVHPPPAPGHASPLAAHPVPGLPAHMPDDTWIMRAEDA